MSGRPRHRVTLACAPLVAALVLSAEAVAPSPAAHPPEGVFDDSQIHVKSERDVQDLRRHLIQFIWDATALPSDFPEKLTAKTVSAQDAADLGALPAGTSVEHLTVKLPDAREGFAWYLVPQPHNDALVIVHAGHQNHFTDPGGLDHLVAALLARGYSVIAVYMPGRNPADGRGHASEPIRTFLDTTLYSLEYARANAARHGIPAYRTTSMIGFSGGGWTTTVYAAVDPSIAVSFPVAGSVPLYLREPGTPNVGDAEQHDSDLYKIAGYPDLYVLGSAGKGRKQIQILNARDTCCFAAAPATPEGRSVPAALLRAYESRVAPLAASLGGSFTLVVDEESTGHMVSTWAVTQVILPELDRRPR